MGDLLLSQTHPCLSFTNKWCLRVEREPELSQQVHKRLDKQMSREIVGPCPRVHGVMDEGAHSGGRG